MIIIKTPFRVSFAGGGSDIASFYEKNGGCVLSTSIDKYMYISVHPTFFKNQTILKYSRRECVENISKIEHDIARICFQRLGLSGVEISVDADIPAGTGLGSSSSFTVGLLHTLYAYKSKYVSKERLAAEACEVEIHDLKKPIGKQDQYAAAYGGLNFFRFLKNGTVVTEPIMMEHDKQKALENNLLMFYTGGVHSASKILAEQSKNISSGDKEKATIEMCHLAEQLKLELENGNIHAMGEILDANWQLKKTLATGISNSSIDHYYEKAILAGALGGKLLGAGGGGFLLFYVEPEKQEALRAALSDLEEIRFAYDHQGSRILYVGDKP